MQAESRQASFAEEGAATSEDASYRRRMLVIQRWRRIAWLVCLFLVLWALLLNLLDDGFQNPSTIILIESIFAFTVSIIVTVNILTFRLRNQPRPRSEVPAKQRPG